MFRVVIAINGREQKSFCFAKTKRFQFAENYPSALLYFALLMSRM